MNAKPILMQPDMVRATLREIREPGTGKWKTRRIMKPQPEPATAHPDCTARSSYIGDGWFSVLWDTPKGDGGVFIDSDESSPWLCPYGQPGDLLAIRETMRVIDIINHGSRVAAIRVRYEADGAESDWIEWPERLQGLPEIGKCLPYGGYREAWRITGVLTDVRVERVQDINEEDAKAEGVPNTDKDGVPYGSSRTAFAALWDHINFARGYGWDTNPWVWVLSYKPHMINVDEYIRSAQIRIARSGGRPIG